MKKIPAQESSAHDKPVGSFDHALLEVAKAVRDQGTVLEDVLATQKEFASLTVEQTKVLNASMDKMLRNFCATLDKMYSVPTRDEGGDNSPTQASQQRQKPEVDAAESTDDEDEAQPDSFKKPYVSDTMADESLRDALAAADEDGSASSRKGSKGQSKESMELPGTSSQASARQAGSTSTRKNLASAIPTDWVSWILSLKIDDDDEMEEKIQYALKKEKRSGRSAQSSEVHKALAKKTVGAGVFKPTMVRGPFLGSCSDASVKGKEPMPMGIGLLMLFKLLYDTKIKYRIPQDMDLSLALSYMGEGSLGASVLDNDPTLGTGASMRSICLVLVENFPWHGSRHGRARWTGLDSLSNAVTIMRGDGIKGNIVLSQLILAVEEAAKGHARSDEDVVMRIRDMLLGGGTEATAVWNETVQSLDLVQRMSPTLAFLKSQAPAVTTPLSAISSNPPTRVTRATSLRAAPATVVNEQAAGGSDDDLSARLDTLLRIHMKDRTRDDEKEMRDLTFQVCPTCRKMADVIKNFTGLYHTLVNGRNVCPSSRDAPARSRTLFVHSKLMEAYAAWKLPYPFKAEWEAYRQSPQYLTDVARRDAKRERNQRNRGSGAQRQTDEGTATVEIAVAPSQNTRGGGHAQMFCQVRGTATSRAQIFTEMSLLGIDAHFYLAGGLSFRIMSVIEQVQQPACQMIENAKNEEIVYEIGPEGEVIDVLTRVPQPRATGEHDLMIDQTSDVIEFLDTERRVDHLSYGRIDLSDAYESVRMLYPIMRIPTLEQNTDLWDLLPKDLAQQILHEAIN